MLDLEKYLEISIDDHVIYNGYQETQETINLQISRIMGLLNYSI